MGVFVCVLQGVLSEYVYVGVGVVREPTNHSAINAPIQLSSVGGAVGVAICLKRARKFRESVGGN